jgi:hypothetical protein
VKCWGENNVSKQRMMVQRVSEECMELPMNNYPDLQLPEHNFEDLHSSTMPVAEAPEKHQLIPSTTYKYP